jgi:hypothetical protein
MSIVTSTQLAYSHKRSYYPLIIVLVADPPAQPQPSADSVSQRSDTEERLPPAGRPSAEGAPSPQLRGIAVEPHGDRRHDASDLKRFDGEEGTLHALPPSAPAAAADSSSSAQQSHGGKTQVSELLSLLTLARRPDGSLARKIVSQRIRVGQRTFELEDIYGLDDTTTQQQQHTQQRDPPETPTAATRADETKSADSLPRSGSGNSDCIICMTFERDSALFPCRHLCACHRCALLLVKHTSRCPICRTPISSIIKLPPAT